MANLTIENLRDIAYLNTCAGIVIHTDPARRYLKHYTQCGGSVEDAMSVAAVTILKLGVVGSLSVGTNIRRWSGYVSAEFLKEIRRSRVYENRIAIRPNRTSHPGLKIETGRHYGINYIVDERECPPPCGEDIFDEIPHPEHRAWLRQYYTEVGQGEPYAHQDRERARRLRNKYRDRIGRVFAA